MLILVALGGNALLRRGEPLSPTSQLANVQAACRALVPLAEQHRLVVTHGNGPQVGLLALETDGNGSFPLDVLGAETEGMIGYLIERELGNLLPLDKELATLLTMIEVDGDDPAFASPSKPIGQVYTKADAERLAAEHGWTVKPDGAGYRRVVASPTPRRIIEIEPIRILLEHGCVVVCAGGGGIPTIKEAGSTAIFGAPAVIDKDLASALLARQLDADVLVMATDVDGVYLNWGTAAQARIARADPRSLRELDFAAGSMGPKIEAACAFAEVPGRTAVIGRLENLSALVEGDEGTRITSAADGIELAEAEAPGRTDITRPRHGSRPVKA